MSQLTDHQRAELRRKSKMRDGDAPWNFPNLNRFWHVHQPANSNLVLEYVVVKPSK